MNVHVNNKCALGSGVSTLETVSSAPIFVYGLVFPFNNQLVNTTSIASISNWY